MNIKNREELVRLVELYKTGKITRYSLEAELSKSFSAAMEPNLVSVSLITEQDGNTNSVFCATLLPQQVGEKVDVTLLLDQELVISLATPAEVVSIAENELGGFQKAVKEITSFAREKKGTDVSLSQALLAHLKIYKDSISRLKDGLPEIFSKLSESRSIQSPESIDSEIKALETDSDDIRFVIERLTISKKFPQLAVLAAKKLTADLSEGASKASGKVPLFYRDDAPVMNQFYQQRRALVDGTYADNKMSKVISHDYKPETNQ
jgi:hypothetical protein